MRNLGVKYYIGGLLLVGVALISVSSVRVSAESRSSNYQSVDTHFGPASVIGSCSDKYCADISIGNTAEDAAASSQSASFRSLSVNHPQLDLIIDSGESNLGVLSTKTTSYKTISVQVRNYISGGYTLQLLGDSPHIDGHILKTLTTQTASAAGHEQFGINAVDNTSPNVGKDPNQLDPDIPNVSQVATKYATADRFAYHSGDMIASSSKQSGRTDYTISMIINVSSDTPVGHYTGDFAVIIVPGF